MPWLALGARGALRDLAGVRRLVRSRGRRHAHSRRARLLHHTAVVLVTVFGLPLLLGTTAWAAGEDKGSSWFAWTDLTDTRGHNVGQYKLFVDTGGVTDPIVAVGAFILGLMWDGWRMLVLIGAWAMDFVLQFRFLEIFRPVAKVLGDVINDTIGTLGVVGLIATISVVVSGMWIFKGRSGAGFGEMAMTVVIVALIGTAVSNPVGWLSKPGDGAVVRAQQFGSAITAGLVTKSQPGTEAPVSDDPAEIRSRAAEGLIDTFIRVPHQMINVGKPIKGKATDKCVQAYEAALKAGGGKEELKSSCGEGAKHTIEHPDQSIMGAFFILPAGFLLLLFTGLLLLLTGVVTGLLLWEAAKLALEMLKALLPGANRGPLFEAMAVIAVCLGALVGAIVAVGVLVLALNEVLGETSTWNPVPVFLLIDFVMLVACLAVAVWLFKVRKSGKKFGRKAASALTPKPSQVPSAGMSGGRKAMAGARTAASMAHQRKMRSSFENISPGGGSAQPVKSSLATRAMKGTAKGAMKATKVGLASTVGAPVAVPRATKAAKSAMTVRKAAMKSKLNTAGKHVAAKSEQVRDYGREYGRNTAAAGKFAHRHTTAPAGRGAAAAGKGAAKLAGSAGRRMAPHIAAGMTSASLHTGGASGSGKAGPADPPSASRPGTPRSEAAHQPEEKTSSRTSSSRSEAAAPTDIPHVAPAGTRSTPVTEPAATSTESAPIRQEQQPPRQQTSTPGPSRKPPVQHEVAARQQAEQLRARLRTERRASAMPTQGRRAG